MITKKMLILKLAFLLAFPLCVFAQIPTTDGGAIQRLNALNRKMGSLKRKLKKVNRQLDETNYTLEKLTSLKEEEVNTYKSAPDNRLVSYQKNQLFKMKTELLREMKRLFLDLRHYEHIPVNQKEKVKKYFTSVIEDIIRIYTQTDNLLLASDKIIPANQRQRLLEYTLDILSGYVSEVSSQNNSLKIQNNERKSRTELIGF